jgi:hypothetical protein
VTATFASFALTVRKVGSGTISGTGLTCGSLALDIDLTYVFAYCRPVGTVVPDATCGIDLECQAGYACLDLTMDGMENPKCVQLCDTVHPCTTGMCDDQPDLADSGGVCR